MKGLPFELIFVLLFGAALLFNVVMQRAARRRQPQAEPDEPFEEEIPEEVWRQAQPTPVAVPAPAAVVPPRRRAAPPIASPVRPRRRFARQSLLGSRREIQDAFVVALILGRCRADEPHQVR